MRNLICHLKRADKTIYLILMIFGIVSCTEKFVGVSYKNGYHLKSGRIYQIDCDSSLIMFDKFTLSKEEFRKLEEARNGFVNKDSTQL